MTYAILDTDRLPTKPRFKRRFLLVREERARDCPGALVVAFTSRKEAVRALGDLEWRGRNGLAFCPRHPARTPATALRAGGGAGALLRGDDHA